MEIENYIDQQKELYNLLMIFVNNENDFEQYFENFIKYIVKAQITNNKDDLKLLLYLIAKISNHHCRSQSFPFKIEQILSFFKENIKEKFTNLEIFIIFQNNKKLILFLFENQFINNDQYIAKYILEKKDKRLSQFFYPEIKSLITDQENSLILERLSSHGNNISTKFEENRKIGENDSYICQMIRTDSYEKFVEYVNQTNLSLSSKIERSLFETNTFLIKNKKTTLIEYAAFFGSIQIFKYLLLKSTELKPSLWLYAIHSNNPEIIHLLETNHIEPEDKSYEEILKESIKCHHNDIAIYIQENFLDQKVEKFNVQNDYMKNTLNYCFHYHNYNFIPNEIDKENKFLFYYACNYGYYKLVNLLFKYKRPNVNETIISYCFFEFCFKIKFFFS